MESFFRFPMVVDAPADVSVDFGTFADTTVTFTAVSDKARAAFGAMFGQGAVSVTVRKSQAPDLASRLEMQDLRV